MAAWPARNRKRAVALALTRTSRWGDHDYFERVPPAVMTALLEACARLAPEAVELVVDWVTTSREVYTLDEIVAAASARTDPTLSALDRFELTARGHLEARVAEPLVAPTTWARDAVIACIWTRTCRPGTGPGRVRPNLGERTPEDAPAHEERPQLPAPRRAA